MKHCIASGKLVQRWEGLFGLLDGTVEWIVLSGDYGFPCWLVSSI